MTLPSSKGTTKVALANSLLYVVSVGGVAVFLIFASVLLVPQPIGSRVRGYFYGIDQSGKSDTVSWGTSQSVAYRGDNRDLINEVYTRDSSKSANSRKDEKAGSSSGLPIVPKTKLMVDKQESTTTLPFGLTQANTGSESSVSSNLRRGGENIELLSRLVLNKPSTHKGLNDSIFISTHPKQKGATVLASEPENLVPAGPVDSECDLYHGKWVYDTSEPLYMNNSCPILSKMQNCQGNGRPDKQYENWRWKPAQCDLPKFNARNFLELMRGKTLAFIGDSAARNQMESMVCMLWQVEVPENHGSKRMKRYYFPSTSTMIVRIWSSWLVRKTSEPFDFAPVGVAKIYLDAPDEDIIKLIPNFDVIVLSSGHWFKKQSAYILNNQIVGGQLWWPEKSHPMKINNVEAFGISVETILTAISTHPNYTGLTILRSFSPDHYEGGAWNTRGSCTGKEKPLLAGELVENDFTNIMHEKQMMGFNGAVKKITNKSKLRLMDITEAFAYRHDGHPGPYRSRDPNKSTPHGPDGKPPPQDCLHWCMPGPVDTWNEMVLEITRRESRGSQSFAS